MSLNIGKNVIQYYQLMCVSPETNIDVLLKLLKCVEYYQLMCVSPETNIDVLLKLLKCVEYTTN
jgi:pentose-5-phosphate-3-epimerase